MIEKRKPKNFELYDKGMRIIISIDRMDQVAIARKWLKFAEEHMRIDWWIYLSRELDAKLRMFKVA